MHKKIDYNTSHSNNYRAEFQYHKVPYSHKMNLKVIETLRNPAASKAFPKVNEHLQKIRGWNNSEIVDNQYVKSKTKVIKVGDRPLSSSRIDD